MESAQNRGYFAPQGWLPSPGLRVASDRPTGGAHGWPKSAAGRATGSELRTRKFLIRLDFIEHKSERSVMPQDTGVGRNVGLDGLDLASLRRVWEQTFGATPPSSLSRVFLRRVLLHKRQCRTHGGLSARNPARSGCHGERDTKLRRSRRVRFCRHSSRPRVEWPDLPGRGNRQRLSVRWQNLSVPHYHRKANHRHPLVRTTLFRSDAQAQSLT